jgi:C6 transcription factor Pro1
MIPARIDVTYFEEGQDDLVSHYMLRTLGMQYLLAGPGIEDLIFRSLQSNPYAYEAACLLSAVHRYNMPKADLENHQRYAAVRRRLIGNTAPLTEGEAMAGLHMVSSFLFSGGTGLWQDYLQVAIHFSKRVLGRYFTPPAEALIRCTETERFIIKTSMWFDVLASVSNSQTPAFMDEYRQIFGRSTAYIEGPVSHASPPKELSMMSIMGCENHIVWAMAEISCLAVWKAQEQRRGCLSMPDLVARGKEIEVHLMPGRTVGPETYETSHFTSEIFRASSRVYLHSVISGDFPHCPEIMEGVQETIDILHKVPEFDDKSRSAIVRSVVFSIFICGCLTDDEGHRSYLLERLSLAQEKESVGNCDGVKQLMESVWRQRSNQKTDPVRWREALQSAAMLLV